MENAASPCWFRILYILHFIKHTDEWHFGTNNQMNVRTHTVKLRIYINNSIHLDWNLLKICTAIISHLTLFIQIIYFSFYAQFHNLVLLHRQTLSAPTFLCSYVIYISLSMWKVYIMVFVSTFTHLCFHLSAHIFSLLGTSANAVSLPGKPVCSVLGLSHVFNASESLLWKASCSFP